MFNWCFIGSGRLAKTVAKQITRSGRHSIVSVYSRNAKKCAELAKRFGAKAYDTAADAISASGVDGVYVVTPHASHYEYSKLALELGKPVLCEKSFTANAKQARELIELSQSRGVYIAEAMWTWFSPVANTVKKWLDDGQFGKIEKATVTWHLNNQHSAPRVTDPNAAGGALLDLGVYPVTYLYRLFGKPEKIECVGKVDRGIDWYEDVKLTFADGTVGTASAAICDNKGFETVRIEGTDGKLKIPFFHGAHGAKLKKKGGSLKFKGDGSFLNEFDIVASEIRKGLTESEFVSHTATLDVMEIMDECRRQMGLVYPFEK